MERYIGMDVHAASCTLAVISEQGQMLRDQTLLDFTHFDLHHLDCLAGPTVTPMAIFELLDASRSAGLPLPIATPTIIRLCKLQ